MNWRERENLSKVKSEELRANTKEEGGEGPLSASKLPDHLRLWPSARHPPPPLSMQFSERPVSSRLQRVTHLRGVSVQFSIKSPFPG